jgi:hypothetical protein
MGNIPDNYCINQHFVLDYFHLKKNRKKGSAAIISESAPMEDIANSSGIKLEAEKPPHNYTYDKKRTIPPILFCFSEDFKL